MSSSPDRVIIRNARQHNLKGITVELPRRALTVITGPSGSGKSSLAFDTLYAEGQRRYIESLSTYAKQFLERMPKPLVDSIDGISPAVAIEQKNPTTTSRSTVGTATEIYDFLRLLWARVGTPYCVKCGREVKADTVQEVVDALIAERGTRNAEQPPAPRSDFRVPRSDLLVAFPLPPSAHRPDVELAAQLRAAGFVRAQVDGALVRLDAPEAERRVREGAEVLVVVDRVAVSAASRGRLTDAVATAFSEGEGVAVTLDNGDRRRFSEHPTCSSCGTPAPALAPSFFSFNNPRGACPACNGFGAVLEYDESLIVPDARRTLAQGALDPWTKPRYEGRRRLVRELADWIAALTLPAFQSAVAVHILAELAARVAFVNDVGLGYLTLDRLTRTLSGGEAQRIALSNALGSHLVDTLYVLDEPSIGLHPADIDRLLGLLRRLADVGNTVVVVEHDAAAMRCADWMVELGPGSGEPTARSSTWVSPWVRCARSRGGRRSRTSCWWISRPAGAPRGPIPSPT